jgi:NAD(P)-dependent dehydrogenase (short-subunit alcohol dehydrogenase family)
LFIVILMVSIEVKEYTMNRVAIITGASKGLGFSLAKFLSQQNDTVIVTARGQDVLKSAAERLQNEVGHVIPIPGDVANQEHRKQVIETARRFGGIDILVNNASSLGPTPMPPLVDFPVEDFTCLFDVKVCAPLGLIQEAIPLLKASRGLVINVSSDAAVGGYEGWGGYGASKAALDLLTLTLGNELKNNGVGVVSVDPGDMRTDMHQAAFPGEDISDRPSPDVTLPFWGWLLGQEPLAISGQRFQAQAEHWEVLQEVVR